MIEAVRVARDASVVQPASALADLIASAVLARGVLTRTLTPACLFAASSRLVYLSSVKLLPVLPVDLDASALEDDARDGGKVVAADATRRHAIFVA